MTETGNPGEGQGNDPAAGTDGRRPTMLPLTVHAQYIKDLSFENPNAPQNLSGDQAAPSVSVNVDVQASQIGEGVFEVVLSIHCEAKADKSVVFLTELAYGGVISLQGVPEQHQRPVVLIEGPRLLFPFARSIIANVSKDAGFPALMINPIDFADLYRRRFAQAENAGVGAGEGGHSA